MFVEGALPLAKRVEQVIGIEGVPEMVQRAQLNAQKNGIDSVVFRHADLSGSRGALHDYLSRYNKILLGPARDGAFEAVKQLTEKNITHILYVSCNLATFARDAALLVEKGYRLAKMSLLDMFPHTNHTELMPLFISPTAK